MPGKKYWNKRTAESLRTYKKQKSYYSWLYKKERKKFFNNLFLSLTKNYFGKQTIFFWQNYHGTNITLVECDEIWNDFFQNAVSNFNIQENSFIQSNDYHNFSDPVQRDIAKYKHHPSVLLIQSKISNRHKFSFSAVKVKLMLRKKLKISTPKKLLPKIISLKEY